MTRVAAAVLVAGAVAGIYARAVSAYFFEDDFQWLVSRWAFHPAQLFDLSNFSHFYRPVIELYFWAGSPIFGGSPRAFHVASILLHLANCGLFFLVVRALGMRRPMAFAASLLFAVQPSYVAAVAWVGALAESVVMFFGCISLVTFLHARSTGHFAWRIASLAAFSAALLTHESAVVLLPLVVLADWTMARRTLQDLVRTFWPFVLVTAAYLAIDLTVNARHYVVTQGQYRIGLHMVSNVFEYIASLYVGERTLVWHLIVAAVLTAVLGWGTPRARFGVAWMILAILPFAPFDTANVSRYAYVPAAGLAIILAEGIAALDGSLGRLTSGRRRAIVAGIVGALAIRFGVFAHKGVRDFSERTEWYRSYLTQLRQQQPTLPDGAVITISAETEKKMALRYLEAAVQWEYRNPTLRVVVAPNGR